MNFRKLQLKSFNLFNPFSMRFFSTGKVSFKFKQMIDNKETLVEAEIGQHLLEIAKANKVHMEGACEASLACSTCHVIVPSEIYKKLPSIKEEEEDLLDLTFGLEETSRLGCQVHVTKEFEGCTILIPAATKNLYDGKEGKSGRAAI